MTALYTNLRTPVSYTAIAWSERTGYEMENLGDPRILRNAQVATGSFRALYLDFGSDVNIAAVLAQDINFATMRVQVALDGSGPSWVQVADETTAVEGNGRRKCLIEVGLSRRYVRYEIRVTTALDGSGWFKTGALYVWGTKTVLDDTIGYGWRRTHHWPSAVNPLPNGRTETATVGPAYTELGFQHQEVRGTDDALTALRAAREEIVGLDLEISGQTELVWPVRHVATTETQIHNVGHAPVSTTLVEVV